MPEAGDSVTFDFSLTLADGTVIDESGDEPLSIVIGRGDLFEYLEQCLLGLSVGEHRRFKISADHAAGNTETLPRSQFPREIDLEPGLVIAFEMPSGEEVAGTVVDVQDEQVVIDFTHPLAGRDLVFDVTIRSVKPHGRTEVAGS